MFMDVVTNFAPGGAKPFLPDPGRRPRARSRPAPQRPPVLAQHPGDQGRHHQRPRAPVRADQGLRARVPELGDPGRRREHRDPRDPPDRHDRRVRDDRQRRREDAAPHDPRRCSTHDGKQVWPPANDVKIDGRAGRLAPGRLHHDRHPGRQHDRRPSTRSGPSGRSPTGSTGPRSDPPRTRPAPRATTRTSTRTATSRLPKDKKLPALVAGVWMGNSDNTPNDGKLSLDTSAPLWSAILSDVSKGMPIDGFRRTKPKGLVTATVDAFTGMQAERRDPPHRRGAVHRRAPSPPSPRATPSPSTSTRRAGSAGRRAASARWSPGRSSTTAEAESGFKTWQKADAAGRPARAAAPASRAARSAPARPTSTAAGSTRSAGRWGGGGFAAEQEVSARAAGADAVRLELLDPCLALPERARTTTPMDARTATATADEDAQKP